MRMYLNCILILLFLFTGSVQVRAHILKEEPWHPVPAIYLRTLFYINLKPVDWELIEKEYSTVSDAGYKFSSIYEVFDQLRDFSGDDNSTAIKDAIERRDKNALYVASTRALSQYIRFLLSNAQENLDGSGAAMSNVQNAKRVYRALESFIEQVDKQSYESMGRSWLELSSSTGSAGVLGFGAKNPDVEKFKIGRASCRERVYDLV